MHLIIHGDEHFVPRTGQGRHQHDIAGIFFQQNVDGSAFVQQIRFQQQDIFIDHSLSLRQRIHASGFMIPWIVCIFDGEFIAE